MVSSQYKLVVFLCWEVVALVISYTVYVWDFFNSI